MNAEFRFKRRGVHEKFFKIERDFSGYSIEASAAFVVQFNSKLPLNKNTFFRPAESQYAFDISQYEIVG